MLSIREVLKREVIVNFFSLALAVGIPVIILSTLGLLQDPFMRVIFIVVAIVLYFVVRKRIAEIYDYVQRIKGMTDKEILDSLD